MYSEGLVQTLFTRKHKIKERNISSLSGVRRAALERLHKIFKAYLKTSIS